MPPSILIGSEEELIHIPLYYKTKVNKYGVRQFKILDEAEGKELVDKKDESVQVLNTKWKAQTWQMSNYLSKNSTTYNQIEGAQQMDINKYQDNIFTHCLVSWDIADEKGEIIPVNPKNIGMLPSSIANALVLKYRISTMMDDEEQSKS